RPSSREMIRNAVESVSNAMCSEERALMAMRSCGQHVEQAGYDRQRDAWLQQEGFVVLRFWNNEVLQETEAVLERIRQAVITLSS
ncbi:MAG: DUF559 domain-containing protein, partial [Pseudomonadota bacterium]|nr:DUF559 domain-containing protein [Pseudomonadota bacterium]